LAEVRTSENEAPPTSIYVSGKTDWHWGDRRGSRKRLEKSFDNCSPRDARMIFRPQSCPGIQAGSATEARMLLRHSDDIAINPTSFVSPTSRLHVAIAHLGSPGFCAQGVYAGPKRPAR
jgi:hypothetical protein